MRHRVVVATACARRGGTDVRRRGEHGNRRIRVRLIPLDGCPRGVPPRRRRPARGVPRLAPRAAAQGGGSEEVPSREGRRRASHEENHLLALGRVAGPVRRRGRGHRARRPAVAAFVGSGHRSAAVGRAVGGMASVFRHRRLERVLRVDGGAHLSPPAARERRGPARLRREPAKQVPGGGAADRDGGDVRGALALAAQVRAGDGGRGLVQDGLRRRPVLDRERMAHLGAHRVRRGVLLDRAYRDRDRPRDARGGGHREWRKSGGNRKRRGRRRARRRRGGGRCGGVVVSVSVIRRRLREGPGPGHDRRRAPHAEGRRGPDGAVLLHLNGDIRVGAVTGGSRVPRVPAGESHQVAPHARRRGVFLGGVWRSAPRAAGLPAARHARHRAGLLVRAHAEPADAHVHPLAVEQRRAHRRGGARRHRKRERASRDRRRRTVARRELIVD
mmetsp:Transcript_4668/g.18683  ORF Transcript_4668/g.18683 Transcript_4668/m.18683 type:complete len:444 (-) Transcript_4668:41-1372(-)